MLIFLKIIAMLFFPTLTAANNPPPIPWSALADDKPKEPFNLFENPQEDPAVNFYIQHIINPIVRRRKNEELCENSYNNCVLSAQKQLEQEMEHRIIIDPSLLSKSIKKCKSLRKKCEKQNQFGGYVIKNSDIS